MILTRKTENKCEKKVKIFKFYDFILHLIYIRICAFSRPNMSTLKIIKKTKILQFFIYFYRFLELKHDVKNVNLENVILVRESEKKQFFVHFFLKFFTKKKIIFWAKVKTIKKLEKMPHFFHFPYRAGGGGTMRHLVGNKKTICGGYLQSNCRVMTAILMTEDKQSVIILFYIEVKNNLNSSKRIIPVLQ